MIYCKFGQKPNGIWLLPSQTWIAMKLTIILLVITLNVTAGGYTQTVTLQKKNAPLTEVFKEIRQQTGYDFLYQVKWLEKSNLVNINVKNTPLVNVLDLCFKDQPLSYEITGTTIVLRLKKSNKAAEIVIEAPVDVHGRVLNEKNEPIADVTITVKGTLQRTSTDSKGEFSLQIINQDAILIFTHVSMETYVLKVSGKTDFIINLKSKISELSNVTISVNTGYQELTKERATGSFATPDKEMFNSRVTTDVISKLEGITSGLLFNRNRINNNSSISIRGRSTIFANTDPLIVVDGFPYDGNINNINPNDIESITILKDASAASIWGVRSGNGVIVVSTKKGKSSRPLQISLSANVTVGEKTDLYYDQRFLNSSDFIDVEKQLFATGYYNSNIASANYPVLTPVQEILVKVRNGTISQTIADAQIDSLRKVDVRNELSKYFYRFTTNQQYAVNISGSSSKSTYYFSLGYDKNLYTKNGNDYQRITINTFNTYNPLKNFELSIGVNLVQNITNLDNAISQMSLTGTKTIYPYALLADQHGSALSLTKDLRSIYTGSAESKGFLNWQFFPLDELNNHFNKTTTKLYDGRINAGIKYVVLSGLNFNLKYQYEKGVSKAETFQDEHSYFTRSLVNRFATYSLLSGKVSNLYNIPQGNILDFLNSDLVSQTGRLQVDYSKDFGENLISILGGIEIRESKVDGSYGRYYGYNKTNNTISSINPFGSIPTNPAGSTNIPLPQGISGTLDRYRSYFLNGAYTYKDRYIISASGRIDQSNLFGVTTNQKTVPLWSVGLKWNVDKESFYHIDWVPKLKFRLTYGYNGNINKTVTAYTVASILSTSDVFGPYNAATITFPGNPELRWERIGMINFGTDFTIKNDILNGSIEYYHKVGKDIIGDAPIRTSTGFSTLRGNFSNLKANGIDVCLNSININREIKWETSILFSYIKDEITKYTGASPIPNQTISGIKVGNSINGVYSLKWGGLDPITGQSRGYIADTLSKDYGTLINQPVDQWIYNGSATPLIFGSIRNSISWKKFSLSANIVFKANYYFRRASISYSDLFNSWQGHADFTKRWQKSGDENLTKVPSMPASLNSSADAFYLLSESLIEKADHIRLQDVSMSYDLKDLIQNKRLFTSLRLYVYVNNIGILWRANENGIDPDYQLSPPPGRTFTVGINANF